MRIRIRALIAPVTMAMTLALLTGCVTGSTSTTYIQLSSGNVAPGQLPEPRVLLASVIVPDFLLRNELMTRVDDYRMQYASNIRWAEPIDIGVQRVIAQRLAAGLNSYNVVSFPSSPRGTIDWRIEITLRRFETNANEGLLVADVQLYPQGEEAARSLRVEERLELAGGGGEDIAAVLSALLSELADRLVDEMGISET